MLRKTCLNHYSIKQLDLSLISESRSAYFSQRSGLGTPLYCILWKCIQRPQCVMLLPQTTHRIPPCEEFVLQTRVPVLSFTRSLLQTVCGILARARALVPRCHLWKTVGLILVHKLGVSASLYRTGSLKITFNKVLTFRLCWFILICVYSFQFLMEKNIFLHHVLVAM